MAGVTMDNSDRANCQARLAEASQRNPDAILVVTLNRGGQCQVSWVGSDVETSYLLKIAQVAVHRKIETEFRKNEAEAEKSKIREIRRPEPEGYGTDSNGD